MKLSRVLRNRCRNLYRRFSFFLYRWDMYINKKTKIPKSVTGFGFEWRNGLVEIGERVTIGEFCHFSVTHHPRKIVKTTQNL